MSKLAIVVGGGPAGLAHGRHRTGPSPNCIRPCGIRKNAGILDPWPTTGSRTARPPVSCVHSGARSPTVSGVSLVSNYRTQFNKIIQTSSYAELVKKMKTKQGELSMDDDKQGKPRTQ